MADQTSDYLIKFCSAQTADKILSTRTLRWSAPHHFEDPLELTYQSELNFSSSELLKTLVKRSLTLIFQFEKPTGNSKVIHAINRWREEERFDEQEEAEEVLTELLSQVVTARKPALDKLLNNWKSYALRTRICCFSERVDNLVAWQRYADAHTGVAFKFRSGENTTLGVAKKILYQDDRPEITTLTEQVLEIMLGRVPKYAEEFPKKFLSKPKPFAAEAELRCFRLLANSPDIILDSKEFGTTDIGFQENDIKEVFLGAEMNPNVKLKLIQKIRKINRQIKIYEAHMSPQKFQLDFVDTKKITSQKQESKTKESTPNTAQQPS
ncbi:hypothetical protein [Sessilibacter corallicola]|uniref:hypothetical protein n=1 Tax=Sessilibacter corallicola TaxID=2904075 RepID=UPI001E63212D|nr:hypothetical protein [Sessilibacter corallicola]MCE2028751.1 hypothetical protein [Sessilibacter corallicola]